MANIFLTMKFVVKFTYDYVKQNNRRDFMDDNDLKKFIGNLFLSGLPLVPFYRSYWSDNEIYGNNLVRTALKRRKYENIKRNLHLFNNKSFI